MIRLFRKHRLLILFTVLSLAVLFSVKAQDVPDPSGASQACTGHTLGRVNGIPACMDGTSLHICENNFPDEVFRGYIAPFDLNGDGKLSRTELNKVTEINVATGDAPYSLEGVRYFSKLACLTTTTFLTELDVSGLTSLTHLRCLFGCLTSLNVSGCTALEEFYCGVNQLTELDVSGCTALRRLDCNGNSSLTELNVSGCHALTFLHCYCCRLERLDVSGCTALTDLNAYQNQLTELNVGGCSALESLSCGANRLTELNISDCPNLLQAYAEGQRETVSGTYTWRYGTDPAYELSCDKSAAIRTVVITAPPQDGSAAVGDTVRFKTAASGIGLKYQWQYKYPDGSWTDSTNATAKTATLRFTAAERHNGVRYRCIVRDSCGKQVTSSSAKLTIKPKITAQPKSISAAVGETARFTVTATGAGLKYQWPYKYPDGSWTNSGYASGKTAELSFAAQAKNNKMQVRCKITDANGKTLTSSAVTLTITPKITAQPKSATAAAGTTAKFTVTATGAGLKYQWQYKYPDGSWTNSGYSSAKTATLSVPVQARYNGILYRCVITDANGKTVTSNNAKLTVR